MLINNNNKYQRQDDSLQNPDEEIPCDVALDHLEYQGILVLCMDHLECLVILVLCMDHLECLAILVLSSLLYILCEILWCTKTNVSMHIGKNLKARNDL